MKHKRELKFVGGNVVNVKQEERNGVQVGIVEGYIATWDIDEGDFFGIKDRFVRGAFVESILEHVQRRRQVRLKDHHGRTVGGFPIEFVKEDDRGLFGVGEINLEVQQGHDLFVLAKQRVLTDFSIGFSVVDFEMDGDLRTITKAIIWEGSVVDEPMNRQANITQVKKDEDENVDYFKTEDIEGWTKRDVEKALRAGAKFSKNAAKVILTIKDPVEVDDDGAIEAKERAAEQETQALDQILTAIKQIGGGSND